MAALLAFPIARVAAPPMRAPADAEIVRLAAQVLADPRSWAQSGLDPALVRHAQARSVALLRDALDTI